MPRVPYHIRLTGLDAPEGSISMGALGDLCRAVVDGAARALRLQAEGVSTRSGPPPDWVREATDFTVKGLRSGSTVLALDVPPLAETPLFGGDGAPADGFRPDETALTVLGRAVADVREGALDSDRVDRGVLDALARFERIGPGIQIEVGPTSGVSASGRFTIDPPLVELAVRLRRESPPDRPVVLTGRLDTIEHAESQFVLLLDDGRRTKGSLAGDGASDRLRDLWGNRVTVQGTARHTLSGRVRFVEASTLRPFAAGDESMSALTQTSLLPSGSGPEPLSGPALATLRGAWPGDESVDALLDALRQSPSGQA